MATYMNNIFNFGRDLPAPFDTLPNKKVGVSSKYGDKTTSTLCATMIKANPEIIYLREIAERIDKYDVSQRILVCESFSSYLDAMERFAKK